MKSKHPKQALDRFIVVSLASAQDNHKITHSALEAIYYIVEQSFMRDSAVLPDDARIHGVSELDIAVRHTSIGCPVFINALRAGSSSHLPHVYLQSHPPAQIVAGAFVHLSTQGANPDGVYEVGLVQGRVVHFAICTYTGVRTSFDTVQMGTSGTITPVSVTLTCHSSHGNQRHPVWRLSGALRPLSYHLFPHPLALSPVEDVPLPMTREVGTSPIRTSPIRSSPIRSVTFTSPPTLACESKADTPPPTIACESKAVSAPPELPMHAVSIASTNDTQAWHERLNNNAVVVRVCDCKCGSKNKHRCGCISAYRAWITFVFVVAMGVTVTILTLTE